MSPEVPGQWCHDVQQLNFLPMAKSSSFFGLRTGSTKSLTFQVYRGQQITKDRVTRVSNPRSEAQMKQRALIPIVAAARAQLKGLIDHSFEGVAYGEPSLREFSKLNLRTGALDVTSYSPNGVSNAGFAALQVSKGSINGDFELRDTTQTYTEYGSINEGPAIAFPALKAGDPADAVFKYLETYAKENGFAMIQPGMQLSFLTVYDAGIAYVGTTEVALSGFILDRIMIPNGDANADKVAEVNGKWTIKAMGEVNANSATIVNDKGDEIVIKGQGEGTGKILFQVRPKEVVNHQNNCGGCLILSSFQNGTWRRSTSFIEIGYEPRFKWTFEDWLAYYKTTGSASKKYLNNGDDPTGIRG